MKCLCHNISISKIVQLAKQLNLSTIEQIVENIDCGKQCMLCRPFIIKELTKEK